MDEQQMQFVDPEWQPPDYNRPGVINLDPRERPSSFETATGEYASQEIPYRERGKLVPQRRTRGKVWFIVIPALIVIVCFVLVAALALPFSSHISVKPLTIAVEQDKSGFGSQVQTQV